MRNIPFDAGHLSRKLPKEVQFTRMQQVIQEALSPAQREVLIAYYFHRRSIPQIAKDRGVHKSTVCRTLHRAENNLRQQLKY